MKKLIIVAAVILVVMSMSSCMVTRGYGCPGQGSGMGFCGYK